MQFYSFVTIAVFFAVASAASTSNLERRITDPGNPANLDNCPPNGGADACNLEQPCSRIRLNYGSPEGGHYIWYNYDITDIPPGIQVGTEISCTDY
ncbi:hypothetical protein J3R30DRAFT_3295341 [Lentinula aciculospora]|uniref:Uncharacterized protein n=1 Tax=Lentinula aciculospora TaxID=153920 RepID=A0A9W9A5W7_9AGAR|nr:hypothetical protein J3R30DRAFT_3295341 [Lentinula aciculospora]